MRRSTIGIDIAVALGVFLASGSLGCDGNHPTAPQPTPVPPQASGFPPRLAAQVPHEAWRPGYALIELVGGAALVSPVSVPGARSRQNTSAAAGATPPGLDLLGGVRVRLVREIIPEGVPATAAGPIVLVALPEVGEDDAPATRRALGQLATDPRVARVEPDRIRHLASTPNDPLWPDQWSLPLINLPQAWEITKGSADIVVAILDTGIVYGHPDLEARLVNGYDFISTPASADDGDTSRDPDPTDTGTTDTSRLHGTHVAGTIGAVTDNGLGIAGVDQRCRLMPVRVLGVDNGDGIDSDIADAIRWTTGAQLGSLPKPAQPAHIINLSFGGPGISFTLQRAIDAAVSQGLLVIAAAGNAADDTATYSPGGLDGVITVGAIDRSGARASYSNYGPRVDLLAPGGGAPDQTSGNGPDPTGMDLGGDFAVGILSTYRDDGIPEPSKPPFTYGTLIGTSQATPHVTGAAALVKSILPGVRQRTLAQLLRATANPSYLCPNSELGGCGAGLLDVDSLLQAAVQQGSCGCSGDLYCQDGSCIVPAQVHPSVYDRPTIHGGYCALLPPTPATRSAGLLPLLLAAALVHTTRRWLRKRRE